MISDDSLNASRFDAAFSEIDNYEFILISINPETLLNIFYRGVTADQLIQYIN